MAETLGDKVLLSHPVNRIEQRESIARVYCENGEMYEGKHVISSIPQALLNRVRFVPPLPPMKLQLIQRIPMGSIIKTMMFYKTAFWRDMNLSGQAVSHDGPVGYTMPDDFAEEKNSTPAIMGFILANESRDMCDMSKEERKNALCKHYAKLFRCDKFLEPIYYVEKNWMEEEFSGGCYVSSMPPGVLTKYGKYLREPVGKVYFAGTETATYHSGYMEGAVQSGERAAREILHVLGKISSDEIWQDEPYPGVI
ncbi:unnamed protein product, partial [Owenia fusiformis]